MAVDTFVRRSAVALTLASTFWLAAPAAAAGHRARMGTDLEHQLSAGAQTIDVIVHGTAADVDQLARRYNLTVKRLLKGGAVLRVTAGQLDALSQDSAVDHLAARGFPSATPVKPSPCWRARSAARCRPTWRRRC